VIFGLEKRSIKAIFQKMQHYLSVID